MVWIDQKNNKNLKKIIKDNTKITNISYINKYNNYYLIKDKKYLYLLKSNFEEIDKIEINKIHTNKKEYEIIYEDEKIMYMNNYKNKKGITFKYYDIYTYELIKEITLGGN